ncbi:MAG TPA: hypothetical protein VMD58_07460 [Acidobacteriaceae bacterium]|nr:hypothetical protein [Acidobacteriaceae bacterium]
MATDALNSAYESVNSLSAVDSGWSLGKRVAFRFAFCYWVLYCLPEDGRVSLFSSFPYSDFAFRWYTWIWHKITPWVAQHLFHFSGSYVTYFATGSGDTALDYVENFLFVVVAVFATVVWSIADRKRKEYGTLYAWLRVPLRLTLAATLLTYGFFKIIPTQFQPPSVVQLLTETYGEASPMGILWTFMGASMAYTIFAGLAEAGAGFLLLFRRTALLGSLASAAVLLNVVMLNFCYDVPVKLYSANLLLMAIFLALPDASRLTNVFILNRPAPRADLSKPWLPRKWMRVAAQVLMAAFFTSLIYMNISYEWHYLHPKGEGKPLPVYGAFRLNSLELNGVAAPSTDPPNPGWRLVVAERRFWVMEDAKGKRLYYQPRFDTKSDSLSLYSQETHSTVKLHYVQPDPGHLVLTGQVAGEQVSAQFTKIDDKSLVLTHRGFHWINEYPFNR